MKQKKILSLTQTAIIAGAYTALTLLLQPLAYGPVQCRVSEALTILPVFLPVAIPGLTLGCFLSNLIGMSGNPAGAWDLLFGPLATLLAALLSYAWRRVRFKGLPVLSALPPIVLNGLIVGTELCVAYGGMPWALDVLWVAVGEAAACLIGGLLLAAVWEKKNLNRFVEPK